MQPEPEELYQRLVEHCDLEKSTADITKQINAAKTEQWLGVRVTTDLLLQSLTEEEFVVVRRAIAAAAEKSDYADGVREAMAGQGVPFNKGTLGLIEKLRPGIGDELAKKLIGLGYKSTYVLEKEATETEVRAALDSEAIRNRIKNAAANATQRIQPGMSATAQRTAWAAAWKDAV